MTNAPPLECSALTVRYGNATALDNVSLCLAPASLTAIIGPNGAGKSTLLKAITGLVPLALGNVAIYGKPFSKIRQRVAYVPQRAAVDWDFPASALDVAAMGLYGRIGWFRPVLKGHKHEALHALDQVGMADLAQRPIGALSGGQQQRVFFARALLQDADILLLDEPLAGVDARTEEVLFGLMASLRDGGRTIAVVHHDLDTVKTHFDHVALINRTLIAAGDVGTTFTPANIARTYGATLATAVAGI
jgi:manganese/zinc/iron transport system ATP- binding protein